MVVTDGDFKEQEVFLPKKIANPALRQHINAFRDFINLIYAFRKKVIHQEGLNQVVFPLVPNWSSFINMSPEIRSYIKRCGDAKSEYKYIS
jgi:hypothetical protein